MNAVLYIVICGATEPCTVTAMPMPGWATCIEASSHATGPGPVFAVCGSDKYGPKQYFTTERPED